MKKIKIISLFIVLICACSPTGNDPYSSILEEFRFVVNWPEGYEEYNREGLKVKAEDVNLGYIYTATTNSDNVATFLLPKGIYRISVSDRTEEHVFNATEDHFLLDGKGKELELTMKHSKAGILVIKEIYSGGCSKAPAEGNYQSDQYVIVHNNGVDTQYLDSLCIGSVHPYNATATNNFLVNNPDGSTSLPSFVPIADAVWQIGGDGKTFPLQAGEDAVICIRGAIDHAATYPLSVNLNKEDYFVTYEANLFPNKTYNPVPGPAIKDDHILKCLKKTNEGINATMISMSSPAVIIYRARGMAMEDYILSDGAIIAVPGATNGAKVLACPPNWVLDAVEVFDGSKSNNKKRLTDDLDASYATLSSTYLGHTVCRRIDEEASAANGVEILMDTNDSSNDFVELEKQSLRE